MNGGIMEQNLRTIGQSVVIKGELSAEEDLTIEGTVEGKVELKKNAVTIGPNGRIRAQVQAKIVSVLGRVNGNIMASDKISIGEQGAVEGDLTAPRIAIADGSHVNGKVEMQRAKTPKASPASGEPVPQPRVAAPR
jgi:cytoskeletal protein CcmA (bactofilin family)